MSEPKQSSKRVDRITEWVSGGRFAVAVEVEASFFSDRPDEPFLSPETARYLEELARQTREENLEAMKRAGRVYILWEGNGNTTKGDPEPQLAKV